MITNGVDSLDSLSWNKTRSDRPNE